MPKSRTLAIVACLFALSLGIALLLSQTSSVEAPETRSSASLKKTLLGSSEEGDGPRPEFPGEAAAHWAGLHETRDGANPAYLNLLAKTSLEEARRLTRSGVARTNLRIEEWGPGNFGGRLRGIAINRTDTSQLLVGSVLGGIWKTVDGGATWNPSDDFLETLAVGSMLVDPDDTDIVWVGTGEGFFNVDAARGLGIFTSTDFGDTWTQLAATANSDFHYVNRVARIPSTNILLAATRTGIHRSTNLGTTWAEVSGISTSSRGFTDLKVDPSDPTRLYAYHYGSSAATRRVYRSTNSGATWSALGTVEGVPTTDIGRMEIGVGTDGVVYLSVANTNDATRGLWRSAAGGNAFAQTASATAFIERQGWYDLPIGVDPEDSNTVFVGAVDIFRTTNAGTVITNQTQWNAAGGPQYVHADIHVIEFDPNDSSIVYAGTDGGIFKSTDGGTDWVSLNNDLRITQYYGIAASPDGSSVIGGTQDNGTHLFFGDRKTYLEWAGGDGGFVSWDQQQPNFLYGSTPFTGMYGSSDGGLSTTSITIPNTAGGLFIQPFTLDPQDGNRMIVGTARVHYSGNVRSIGSSTWQDVSGTLGTISATTISPLDGEVAYVGTTAGDIYTTSNLSTATPGTWTQIDQNIVPGSDVTWIEVDPTDATGNTLYATFADYGANRIWKTTNGGTSWQSVHNNLPDIPLFSVRVDPTDANRLFLGSELGLFTTGEAGLASPTWIQYDYGTAYTRVMQLHWAGNDILWAGTHGRSIYRIYRSPVKITADLTEPYINTGSLFDLPVTVTNRGGDSVSGSVMVSVSSTHPSIHVVTGPQALADLSPGASGMANFDIQLTDDLNCLESLELEVTVDWAGGTGSETFTLMAGAQPVYATGTLLEDGEDTTTLFTTEAALGIDDWARVTDQANTGGGSWFSEDVDSYSDKSFISPWLEVQAGTTTVGYSLYYDMEGAPGQYWDGVVLELQTEGGDWIDIGSLSTVAYDGPLQNNNTIPSRDAWSGSQTSWRDATVDLGATYNGQRVRIRFRVVTDTAANAPGFWVDDISIDNVRYVSELSCVLMFADDFESGDTAEWTATVN